MGKSSGSGSTVQSTSGPPQAFLNAYTDTYNQAKGLTQQPFQQYGGPMVAGFSPDQQAAFGTIQNSQGLAQPYFNQAAAYMGSAATPISPMGFDNVGALPSTGAGYFNWAGQQAQQAAAPISLMDYNIDPYLSPYTEDVTNALSNTFAQNNATQYNQIRGNAAAQGAYGGDREAVAEAQTAQQQDLAQQQTLAGVRQQGFSQANQEFNAQQAADYQRQVAQKQYALSSGQLGLGIGQGMWGEFNTQQQQDVAAQEASAYLQAQAGSGMANLGNLAQNSALSGAQAQMTAGGMQQQLEQQMLNVPYYQFMAQQAYPYQQAGWLANIAEGLGGASGGTGSTTYPGPSAISQIGGLATAGAGVYGLGSQQGWWGGSTPSTGSFTGAGDTFGGGFGLGDWGGVADGGAIKRAPGGAVGLGVPPEYGGAGIPGMDGGSYIPGASGMGAAPASKSGGLLHSAFSQPVTTQTQSGGGGGGLGDILGLGMSAAKLFALADGGVPRGTGLAHGYASGGGPHAAAPMVADLTHVAAPSSLAPPSLNSLRPTTNYAPSFDANGYPGALHGVPSGSAVAPPLSIPMSNGVLNRAALNPVAAPTGLTSPPTAVAAPAAFTPFVDMGGNLGGGGASGGHVGLGGIGHYDGGGMVYPDLSQGYIPALQAARQTMGPPKPPTMPGWHPDQGLSSQSTLDMLKAVKGSGLLNESMGGAVMPSSLPLQYDDGGGISMVDIGRNHRDDAIDAALPARWTRDLVLPPYGRVDRLLSSLIHSGSSPQLTYPTGQERGFRSRSNEPILDGPSDMWEGIEHPRFSSPAERGFISDTTPLQYDDGGMVSPIPPMMMGPPQMQQRALMQQFQGLPTEKLRELAMRYPAGTPQGSAIQRSLQMRQISPSSYPGGAGPAGPYGPQGDVQPGTTAARGGRMGLAAGGIPVVLDYFAGDDEAAPHQWSYNNPARSGLGVSQDTLNILHDHSMAGMTPVERSIATQPSYAEWEVIPRGQAERDAAFEPESRAMLERQQTGGREDALLRALQVPRGYQDDTPTWPRVNGMSDAVNWPQGSMARGGGLADGGYPWEDYIEPPVKRPEDERPKPPPTHVGLAEGGFPEFGPDFNDVKIVDEPPPLADVPSYDKALDAPPRDRAELPRARGLDAPPAAIEEAPDGTTITTTDTPLQPTPVPQVTSAPGGTNGIVPRETGSLSPPPAPSSPARDQVVNFWTSNGAPQHVAEGIADRVNVESGFKPAIFGDNGTSGGYYQHHADRLERLQAFAQTEGKPWTDPDIQNRFALSEVQGGDAIAAKHWGEILNAPDRQTASTLWDKYFERSKYGPGSTSGLTLASGISPGYRATIPGGADPVVGPGTGRPGLGDTATGTGLASPPSNATSTASRDKSPHTMRDIMASPWMTLIGVGAGMMASRSPYPGVALGEGLQTGLKLAGQGADRENKEELTQVRQQSADNQSKHLADMADQARVRANETSAHNQASESLRQQLADAATFRAQTAMASAASQAEARDIQSRLKQELAEIKGNAATMQYGQGPDPNDPSKQVGGIWAIPKSPDPNKPNGGVTFYPGVGAPKAATGERGILDQMVKDGLAKDIGEAQRLRAEYKRDPNGFKNSATYVSRVQAEEKALQSAWAADMSNIGKRPPDFRVAAQRKVEAMFGAAPAVTGAHPAAPGAPAAPPAAAAPAAQAPPLPPGAIDKLKADPSPSNRAFFDQTFGAGAAARVLGQ